MRRQLKLVVHGLGLVSLLSLVMGACGGSQPKSNSGSDGGSSGGDGDVSGDGDGDGDIDTIDPGVEAKSGKWSDKETWPNGELPAEGEDILIPEGTTVTLDVSPPNLGDVLLEGTLKVEDKDLEFTAKNIMVHGHLQAGTEEEPFKSRLLITLTDPDPERNLMGMGARGVMVMGGQLDLHGAFEGPTWTQLGDHAAAGTSELTLKENVSWKKGDKIAIAPTDYFDFGRTESAVIESVDGDAIVLGSQLTNSRWGVLQYVTDAGVQLDPADTGTNLELNERAEVANLTRNIVVQAADDDVWKDQEFGAQVMMMEGAQARIDGVEFRRMGQAGHLGRYPVHFHRLSYDMEGKELADLEGQYVRNSAIWDSSQRCLVIHASNGLTVEDNVCYDIKGHAFFLEDAVERRNVLRGNLVLHVNTVDDEDILLNHEKLDSRSGPAGYWITNPDNTIEDNAVADSVAMGFWLSFPANSQGASKAVTMHPTHMFPKVLAGFVAHSNGRFGMMFDIVPVNDAGDLEGLKYNPRENGAADGATLPFQISGLLSYKHIDHGTGGSFWNNSTRGTYRDFTVADFTGFGFKGASNYCTISGGLVVATSLNTPATPVEGLPTVGVATYHSECVITSNTFVNIPYVEGQVSGAFSTEDYYTKAVDRGMVNNYGNLLINSHPGWRAPSPNVVGTDNFAMAGAVYDANQYWGNVQGQPGYWVYDLPFFTEGQECSDASPGNNQKLCAGPYFGLGGFRFNGESRENWPVSVKRVDNSAIWYVPDGAQATKLGAMRHGAVLQDKEFELSFPDMTPTEAFFIEVDNVQQESDTFILAVPYGGSSDPGTIYTTTWPGGTGVTTFESYAAWRRGDADWRSYDRGEYWEPLVKVETLDGVRTSSGGVYYFDAGTKQVWVRFKGGRMTNYVTEDMFPTDERLVNKPIDLLVDSQVL